MNLTFVTAVLSVFGQGLLTTTVQHSMTVLLNIIQATLAIHFCTCTAVFTRLAQQFFWVQSGLAHGTGLTAEWQGLRKLALPLNFFFSSILHSV